MTTDTQTKPRRTRGPSPQKTASTRASILRAGLDQFLEQGFAGTRMNDVASKAGVAKGTLYLHFPDKNALMREVLAKALGDPLAQLRGLRIMEQESTKAFIQRALLPIFAHAGEDGRADLVRLVATDGVRYPELGAIYRAMVIDPMKVYFATLVERARARGELRSEALVQFPLLLVAPALLATLSNGLSAGEEAMDIVAALEAFLDMAFVD